MEGLLSTGPTPSSFLLNLTTERCFLQCSISLGSCSSPPESAAEEEEEREEDQGKHQYHQQHVQVGTLGGDGNIQGVLLRLFIDVWKIEVALGCLVK